METSIKRMVDDRFVRKDGTCLVYIQYRYAPVKKRLLSTDIAIPPKYWDDKEGYIRSTLPSVYGVPEELNLELRRMYRIAEDMVLLIRKLKSHIKRKTIILLNQKKKND